jgi:hypothetical protein
VELYAAGGFRLAGVTPSTVGQGICEGEPV